MMSHVSVCGYLIVRRADEVFDQEAIPPHFLSSSPPQFEDVFYSGVDRLRWYELAEAEYAGQLPGDIAPIYASLREENQPYLDLMVMRDYDDAMVCLEFSNRMRPSYECIAIYSKALAGLKGSVAGVEELRPIGMDLYLPGYGSLLLSGLFRDPVSFLQFREDINEFGLWVGSGSHVRDYLRVYKEAQDAVELEPIRDYDIDAVDQVEVYALGAAP